MPDMSQLLPFLVILAVGLLVLALRRYASIWVMRAIFIVCAIVMLTSLSSARNPSFVILLVLCGGIALFRPASKTT
jgi:hypothetical protein